jgi:hypothetical protein
LKLLAVLTEAFPFKKYLIRENCDNTFGESQPVSEIFKADLLTRKVPIFYPFIQIYPSM